MNMVRHVSALERALDFRQRGFSVVPLGEGPEGKHPSVRKWKGVCLPPEVIQGRMAEATSQMYGVCLEGMTVLDMDEKDEAILTRLEARFGSASVVVETPRGFHLYYAFDGSQLPRLKGEGLPVDIKSGPGHYTVGPGSIRPCGGTYIEVRGRLGMTPLRPMLLPSKRTARGATKAVPKSRLKSKVKTGARHRFLLKKAIEFVETCRDQRELTSNLVFIRDEEVEYPDSVSDDEVRRIAEWTWDRFISGRLFAINSGCFRMQRHHLRRLHGNSEAIALYAVLCDKHGHTRGKSFSLSHKAMRDKGLIDLSERGFDRAVGALLAAGAIVVAAEYATGIRKRQYALGTVLPVEWPSAFVNSMKARI